MVAFLVYSSLLTPYTTRTIRDIELYFQLDLMICFVASFFSLSLSALKLLYMIHLLDPASISFVSLQGGAGVAGFLWKPPRIAEDFSGLLFIHLLFLIFLVSPLGDRHHWETSPRKISCQIFKGSIGNNQKLAQDQSNIQATFSKFPSKNQKKNTFFSGENEHVILAKIFPTSKR